MISEEIGVALVGTGFIAGLHARALDQVQGARCLGGYDAEPGKAEAFVAERGGTAYRSLDELLADPAVDAVSVLTPKEDHVVSALAALEAGKHVFVEKPVAPTRGEIETIRDAADKAGRLCVPGHNYIHAPAMRRAKRHLDEGRFGKVSSMWMIYNFQFGDDWAEVFGGVIREICIHHAYSVLHFLGRPSRLRAVTSNAHFETVDAEDQVMIVCELPAGALANLWCSVAANDITSNPWALVYKILGTEGGFHHTWNECRFARDTLGYGVTSYLDSFYYEIDYFVNQCVARGVPPLSTLDDAIDALSVLEAVEAAAAGGCAIEIDYG